MVNIQKLWSDDDLPPNPAWERPPVEEGAAEQHRPRSAARPFRSDRLRCRHLPTGGTLGPEPIAPAQLAAAGAPNGKPTENEVPPAPTGSPSRNISTERAAG